MLSRFLLLVPSFIEKEALKKFQNISPNGIAFINQGEIVARLHMKLQIVTINYSYMYDNYDMTITTRVQLWGKGEVIIQTL